MNSKSKNWSAAQRLAFIDFRLKWYGKISRADLIDHFKISVPQASLDIASYRDLAPNNIHYDLSAKKYVRGKGFVELYSQSSSATVFLADLLVKGENDPSLQSMFSLLPSVERSIDDSVATKIVHAIKNEQAVQIKYQSMTTAEPSIRKIIPKTLVFTGSRWHVRAFCQKRQKYLDFLFARILEVSDVDDDK